MISHVSGSAEPIPYVLTEAGSAVAVEDRASRWLADRQTHLVQARNALVMAAACSAGLAYDDRFGLDDAERAKHRDDRLRVLDSLSVIEDLIADAEAVR